MHGDRNWQAMGKQPIIGGLCYVKLNGLKDSHLLCLLVYHSIPLEDIQIQHNSYVIIHILYICSVPDVEIIIILG